MRGPAAGVGADGVEARKLVVEKVVAYVTWAERLLVFRHTRLPQAGIQVPAGTIEAGERPELAVLREAREESGLEGLAIEAFLGRRELDMSPWGRDEIQRRHFYHLLFAGSAPERWRHLEASPSDGGSPIEFELYWVAWPDGVPGLAARQGELLSLLVPQPA